MLQSPGPSKDAGDGVGAGRFSLKRTNAAEYLLLAARRPADPYPLVFTVVSGDGAVGGLGLDRLPVRTHEH